jgi:hypothetical protein
MTTQINNDVFQILTISDMKTMGDEGPTVLKQISSNLIKQNMQDFICKFGQVLDNVSKMGAYSLSEVTVNVGIAASGEIQLIGLVRGSSNITAGIALKFQKPPI